MSSSTADPALPAEASGRVGRAPGTVRSLSALVILSALLGTIQIRSVDFFWHLVAGRWLLEHGSILRHDPFRFTSEGAPWVDHEWLFQWVLAVVDAAAGTPGLVALRAVYAVVLGALLWWLVRREGASPLTAALLAGLALAGVRNRLLLRPELATFLGLALLLLLLQSARRRGGWLPLAALLGVTVVWVNAHPGALVAPVVVGLFFAGAALGERRAGDRSAVAMWLLRGAIATTAVGLALLLNPFEAHVFRVPFAISGALADLPGYNPDWSPSWRAVRPLYFAALGGTTLVAVVAARRGARLDPSWVGVAAAMAALSLLQARQQPLFWIAAMALAGSLASASVWTRREKIVTRIAGTIVLLAVAGWALRPYGPWAGRAVHPELGTGIQAGLYPEAAVAELERTWPDLGPLYHDVAFGGYLLWRTFPGRQVFWDTRNELEPELLAEVGRARQDGRLWFAMLDRYEIDGALVRYDEDLRPVVELGPDGPRVVGHQTTNALFFPRPLFALVYWDDLAMLFVRRTPAREARLAEREYAFLHPEDWLAVLERSRNDAELRGSVREELERRLGETPVSQRALGMWRDVQGLPFPGGQTHR